MSKELEARAEEGLNLLGQSLNKIWGNTSSAGSYRAATTKSYRPAKGGKYKLWAGKGVSRGGAKKK